MPGNPAYLVTGSPSSDTFTITLPHVGPVNVKANGYFYVNWGDGTMSGPYDTPGAPWPNGTITHVWENAGAYDVVVTEVWTATWSAAGRTGTLGGLQTSATMRAFPVRQVVSIRNR